MALLAAAALCLNTFGLVVIGWVLRNGLDRIHAEIAANRKTAASARAAQDHDREVYDRRMTDLEAKVAAATNEVRIATDQVNDFLGRCVPGRWRPMRCSSRHLGQAPVPQLENGSTGAE